MKEISVVAAIIINNNKILCVQRGENKLEYISKKYEFPGGKIEKNETLEEAVIREINEELNMFIKIDRPFNVVKHKYPDFYLTMYTFLCSCENPTVKLTEHIDYKWFTISELKVLDWAEADKSILIELLNL